MESEFDQAAGREDGIAGGPPQFLKVTAARCVRDALAGCDRGEALVFPVRAYRTLMVSLTLLPRALQRRQAARSATGLRRMASGEGLGG